MSPNIAVEMPGRSRFLPARRPVQGPEHARAKSALTAERKIRKGNTLFCEGAFARYAYEIVYGNIKAYRVLADGRRIVLAFLTDGDLVGFPNPGTYLYTAEALTPTLVRCHDLQSATGAMPASLTSDRAADAAVQALEDAYCHMMSLGRKKPAERVAAFLQKCRQWPVGLDGTPRKVMVDLPMSRIDIADHLGLTQETVCRIFSQLKRDGILQSNRSDLVTVTDLDRLNQLAEGVPEGPGAGAAGLASRASRIQRASMSVL